MCVRSLQCGGCSWSHFITKGRAYFYYVPKPKHLSDCLGMGLFKSISAPGSKPGCQLCHGNKLLITCKPSVNTQITVPLLFPVLFCFFFPPLPATGEGSRELSWGEAGRADCTSGASPRSRTSTALLTVAHSLTGAQKLYHKRGEPGQSGGCGPFSGFTRTL